MNVVDIEEKRLEKLPPREFAGRIMSLPPKRRQEAILQRSDARRIVSAMAPQDFYITVQEIGPDDALALLSLAGLEQLDHLFDLEWWEKAELRPANALEWIARLAEAGEDQIVGWLRHADFELLVALFKQWIQVAVAPEDVDVMEARDSLPPYTIDDTYYWDVRYPQYVDLVTNILGVLFELHQGFYRELMSTVLWATAGEVEEDAFRFHRARIMDKGIPDYYDSLEIYRPLRPGEIDVEKLASEPESSESAAPSFAVAAIASDDLLARALAEIDDPAVMDSIRWETAGLAGKVMVADRLPPALPDSMRYAVRKASAGVGLGLDLLASGSVPKAVNILQKVYLEHLFRFAYAQMERLRRSMRRLTDAGRITLQPGGSRNLEPEWMEAIQGLLEKIPRIPAPVPGKPPREEFFKTKKDLEQGIRFIKTVAALEPLFRALSPSPETIEGMLWDGGMVRNRDDLTLGVMIFTAAARSLFENVWSPEPLPLASWPEIYPLVTPERMGDAVHRWVGGVVTDPARRSLVDDYIESLLRAWTEETASFTDTLPDPAYLRFLAFTA